MDWEIHILISDILKISSNITVNGINFANILIKTLENNIFLCEL